MKTVLKIVVLWLMLLALPLQGFAASAMTCCGPSMQAMDDGASGASGGIGMDGMADMAGIDRIDGTADMESTPMDHSAMTATMTASGHSTPAPTACASCVAHCASFAVMPFLASIDQPPSTRTIAIPFRPVPSTAFVPGTPERPPQPFLV